MDSIKARFRNDLAILGLIGLLTYLVSSRFDIVEQIYLLSHKTHDPWNLDELLIVGFVLAIALSLVSTRRSAELLRADLKLKENKVSLKKKQLEIEALRGILPICAACKNIRDDDGYWHMVEEYVESHSDAHFTHSLCPDCAKDLYPGLKSVKKKVKLKR